MISPYKFKTAQAHYEALLDEARSRGGRHSIHTPRCRATGAGATFGTGARTGTRTAVEPVSDSTLAAHRRVQEEMVQEAYHDAHTNAPQWPAQVLLA
jgi:hypothetical protein